MTKIRQIIVSPRLLVLAFAIGLAVAAVGNVSATSLGLVSYWRANGDTTDAFDGNHGTLKNGAGFAAGKVGQAFSLDGVNDYVVATSTGVPVGGSPRTVKLWIKPDANSLAANLNNAFFYGITGVTGKAFGIDMDGITSSGNVKI